LTPSYSLYPVLAAIHDSPIADVVPLGNDCAAPDNTTEQWNAAKAPLAIITNPHAPSGTLISATELGELARTLAVYPKFIFIIQSRRNRPTSVGSLTLTRNAVPDGEVCFDASW
jgi:histidinol-phosphate/aromatic aminotransferase/cobyric acid decarboxylase-like protein